MFTRQAPALHTALWQGGLSPASASQVQNLLGQCRQTLVHRGPIEIDYTSPQMRLITPEIAAFRFPNLKLNPPEVVKKRPRRPEDPPPEEAPPDPQPPPLPPPQRPIDPLDPDGPGGGGGGKPPGYTEGDYIGIENNEIRLRGNDARRHCVFPAGKNVNNTINSIDLKAYSSDPERIKFTVKDDARDTTFKIDVSLKQFTYVKSVTLDESNGKIYIERGTAYGFDVADTDPQDIPLTTCKDSGTSPTAPTTPTGSTP